MCSQTGVWEQELSFVFAVHNKNMKHNPVSRIPGMRKLWFLLTLPVLWAGVLPATSRADFNEEYEKATKAAIAKVSPSIVQIVTQGGTDLVVVKKGGAVFRKNMGPTTGVILSEDGYIISSAFNFINNPTKILVEVPGKDKAFPAKKIATDKSRMLTLLKVDAKGLPVPEFTPSKELKVGQWALALGRALDQDQNNPPSVCVGIISALDRVWGKCFQADSNTSPINYGGPMVDIRGRVQGIIVPASPRKEGETAGYEWYDSGIGFAVPMDDVLAVLPKLKKGQDLKKGLLGVQMKSGDLYGSRPVIGKVLPKTAAAMAGLKPGDLIEKVDGRSVNRMAQILHALGPKYEGDTIKVTFKRGNEVKTVNVELVGKVTSVANSYMGILPMRDDPKLGVEIRHVYKGSPADKAGLKPGDRIVKYGKGTKGPLRGFKGQFFGQIELYDFLNSASPGEDIRVEVARKEGKKSETLTVTLADFPGSSADDKDTIPEKLPDPATVKKALAPLENGKGQPKPAKVDPPGKKDEPETGLIQITAAGGDHKYFVYVHDDYDPNISHAVLVWFHLPEKNKKADMEAVIDAWSFYCARHNILIVFPITENREGWRPSDSSFVQDVVRDAMNKYTTDRQRVIAHGMGVGGQMAIHMGFAARDLIRGVASTGSVPTKAQQNVPNRRLLFFVVAGDRDPLAKAIAKGQEELRSRRLPTIYREIKGMGRQYLDVQTLEELVRWIDSLDRM